MDLNSHVSLSKLTCITLNMPMTLGYPICRIFLSSATFYFGRNMAYIYIYKSQFGWFDKIDNGVGKQGVSAMTENKLLRGRPNGGAVILWRKT